MIKRLAQGLLHNIGFEIRRTNWAVPMTRRWMREFRYLSSMFEKIQTIPGDIVECGVGKGRTFTMLAHFIADGRDTSRMLWGFDSFQGFPEPSSEDSSSRNPRRGDWSDTSIQKIMETLDATGFEKKFMKNKIRLVSGFFHESLKKYPERPIALLHIDSDLYQSYKDTLTLLFPRVAEDGVVLFDEYKEEKWPGATKAIDEYFANKPYRIDQDEYSKKYFLQKHPSKEMSSV